MSKFNLASGPRSQFLAWTGVVGAGIIAYITVKRRTSEKKKIDMQNKLAAQASAESSSNTTPVYRGGGVGISTASAAYQQAAWNKQPPKAKSHFLPGTASETSALDLGLRSLADYRKTDPPLSLREYREKMALLDRNME